MNLTEIGYNKIDEGNTTYTHAQHEAKPTTHDYIKLVKSPKNDVFVSFYVIQIQLR